jgi:hypothetical protein
VGYQGYGTEWEIRDEETSGKSDSEENNKPSDDDAPES